MSILNRGSASRGTQDLHNTLNGIAAAVQELRDNANKTAPEPTVAKTTPTTDEKPSAEIKPEIAPPVENHHDLSTETRRSEKPPPPLPSESAAPPPIGKSGPEVREFEQEREAARMFRSFCRATLAGNAPASERGIPSYQSRKTDSTFPLWLDLHTCFIIVSATGANERDWKQNFALGRWVDSLTASK